MRSLALGLILGVLMGPLPAESQSRLDSEQRFSVSIRNQDVRDVFTELSSVIGIPILISDSVNGRVSASFNGATATELLDTVAKERALDWRYDGRRIEVTARSEQATRILDLDGVRLAELSGALDALGVQQDKFPISAVDGEFAMIVAPPSYTALVEVVLGALIERRVEAVAEAEEAEKARSAMQARADEQRFERERLERAAVIEMERDRLRAEQQRLLLPNKRGPAIVRNGVWGG